MLYGCVVSWGDWIIDSSMSILPSKCECPGGPGEIACS